MVKSLHFSVNDQDLKCACLVHRNTLPDGTPFKVSHKTWSLILNIPIYVHSEENFFSRITFSITGIKFASFSQRVHYCITLLHPKA